MTDLEMLYASPKLIRFYYIGNGEFNVTHPDKKDFLGRFIKMTLSSGNDYSSLRLLGAALVYNYGDLFSDRF